MVSNIIKNILFIQSIENLLDLYIVEIIIKDKCYIIVYIIIFITMKLLNISLFTTLFSKVTPTSIPTKKICKDCRYFIGNSIECRKFGDTNIVTGKITYESALQVRKDEKKCGPEAILFEENHFKIITVPYYFLKDDQIALVLLAVGSFTLYFFALNYEFSLIK